MSQSSSHRGSIDLFNQSSRLPHTKTVLTVHNRNSADISYESANEELNRSKPIIIGKDARFSKEIHKIEIVPQSKQENTDPNLQIIVSILKKNPEYRNEKDLNILVPLIKEIEFFKQRQIQNNFLVDICMELRHEHLRKGDFVFHQGDYGDRFYIILSGKVQVLINNTNTKKKKKVKASKFQVQGQKAKKSVRKPMLHPQTFEEKRASADRRVSQQVQYPQKSLITQEDEPLEKQSFMDSGKVNLQERIRKGSNSSGKSLNQIKVIAGDDANDDKKTNKSGHSQLNMAKDDETVIELDDQDDQTSYIGAQEDQSLYGFQEPEEDEDFNQKYIQVATLQTGQSFGDLALIEQKPRMASIRCLQETHFAILSKIDFNKVLGTIEKKKYNEKVQFL